VSLRAGTRPLVPKAETKLDGDAFRRACFARWGRTCFFDTTMSVRDAVTGNLRPRRPDERCQRQATDPGHVVPRSSLGPKTRYALPFENSRPVCRVCHNLEDVGRLAFPDAVYNRAVRALNKMSPRLNLQERR
jgi:hypothetical protein